MRTLEGANLITHVRGRKPHDARPRTKNLQECRISQAETSQKLRRSMRSLSRTPSSIATRLTRQPAHSVALWHSSGVGVELEVVALEACDGAEGVAAQAAALPRVLIPCPREEGVEVVAPVHEDGASLHAAADRLLQPAYPEAPCLPFTSLREWAGPVRLRRPLQRHVDFTARAARSCCTVGHWLCRANTHSRRSRCRQRCVESCAAAAGPQRSDGTRHALAAARWE